MAVYEWTMPFWAYETYHELLSKIEELPEFSPEWQVAIDELQSLPGYPVKATEMDLVDPKLRSTR